jgi:RNA polymerase primary sigma factor
MVSAAALSPVASSDSSSGRTQSIRRLNFAFIAAPDFPTLTLDLLREEAPETLYRAGGDHSSSALLTPAGERHLFRKFNFLKYTAKKLRKQLKSDDNIHLIDQIEALWSEALQIRNQLVQANVRLVYGLAQKYGADPEEVDDFVSEGCLILMQAIDKFDYSKGFRFSTYATHSVQRHFFRLIQRRQRRKQRETLSPTELMSTVSAPEVESSEFNPAVARELIKRFDQHLNPREKSILEQRLGLGGEQEATLKTIAEQIGLSKERVRQLQMSAIQKLQHLASDLNLTSEMSLPL